MHIQVNPDQGRMQSDVFFYSKFAMVYVMN